MTIEEEDIKKVGIAINEFRAAMKNIYDQMLEDIKKIEPIDTGSLKRFFEPDPHIHIIPCPVCAGTGKIKLWWIFKRKCQECGGSGKIIEYHIPTDTTYAHRIEYGKAR